MIRDKGGFNVVLDRKTIFESRGMEIGLRGKKFSYEGNHASADSIQELLEEGLAPVPIYSLIRGMAVSSHEEAEIFGGGDGLAERITAFDPEGIMGKRGSTYVLDIQNGGLFVRDHERMRIAVLQSQLTKEALQISQKEVNLVLDAINRKDYKALNEIVKGQVFVFSGNYQEFLEASSERAFLGGGMYPRCKLLSTYIVVRTIDEARNVPSGSLPIDSLRKNQDLIIASGGRDNNENMLAAAKKFSWKQFGSNHDGYKNKNCGYGLKFSPRGQWGLTSSSPYIGNFVGVSPAARDAFYLRYLTGPLEKKIMTELSFGIPLYEGKNRKTNFY